MSRDQRVSRRAAGADPAGRCAERLGVRQVATVDRRHFAAVRPSHVPEFELLPPAD